LGLSFIAILFLSYSSKAQLYVDTVPLNKNVLIEEFTAVHCSFCPAGHDLLDSLIDENPGRVFGIAMHPDNTSYTAPYSGSPDFRRSFLNAFFSVPYATDSVRFFPGAFVNRREWDPGRRERYTTTWRIETDSALLEPAPLNIASRVYYEPQSGYYTIFTEVYCTDTVNFPMYLSVFMVEDSLIAEQNNGGVNYVHNHIFREGLTAQWGDSLGNYALPGTLFADTLYFQDSAFQYNWARSHFVSFVRNATNEEVVNVAVAPVYDLILTDVVENAAPFVRVFPNPFRDHFSFTFEGSDDCQVNYALIDIQGRRLVTGSFRPGSNQRIDVSPALAPGVYFLQISNTERSESIRIIKLP
jgi:hypothetical protein